MFESGWISIKKVKTWKWRSNWTIHHKADQWETELIATMGFTKLTWWKDWVAWISVKWQLHLEDAWSWEKTWIKIGSRNIKDWKEIGEITQRWTWSEIIRTQRGTWRWEARVFKGYPREHACTWLDVERVCSKSQIPHQVTLRAIITIIRARRCQQRR